MRVTLDGQFTPWEAAEVEERTWNGFLCPWFTLETGKAIVATLDAAHAEMGGDWRLTYDEARDVFADVDAHGGPEVEDWPVKITAEGVKLYGIGNDGWIWTPAPEPVWIVENWTGKRVWPERTFGSFEEARDAISEYADAEADKLPEAEREDTYNGICDDLYAEELKETN